MRTLFGNTRRLKHVGTAMVVALLVLVLPPGTGIPDSTIVRAAEDPDITAMFLDGWYPDAYGPARPLTITGDAITVDTDGRNVVFDGTMDGRSASVIISTESEDLITRGRIPHTKISAKHVCGVGYEGWADVLELERAPDGTLTKFAASVYSRCRYGNPLSAFVHAEVRYHSTIGFYGVGITPVFPANWIPPITTIAFGETLAGERSGEQAITVTNTGTYELDVDLSTSTGHNFVIDGSACNDDLAPGASCDIRVRFVPVAVGAASATVTVTTPQIGDTERTMLFTGTGTANAEITVIPQGPPSEDYELEGMYWFRFSVDPPEAKGGYRLHVSCDPSGHGISGAWVSTAIEYWLELPPGPCSAWANFDGMDGWLLSESEPVDFVVPSFSAVVVEYFMGDQKLYGISRPGDVTVKATVSATNGVEPTAGTLVLRSLSTNDVLVAAEITPENRSVSATVSVADVGWLRYRGEYSGDDSVVGDTSVGAVLVDATPPDGTVVIDDGAPTTDDENVELDMDASDADSEVKSMRVANTGTTSGGLLTNGTSMAASSSLDWVLLGGDGPKKVWVQWSDGAGNWSKPESGAIVLDRTGPAVGAPAWRIKSGAALVSGKVPVSVRWSGTDVTSGIALYEIQKSTDGGAYSSVSTNATSSSLTTNLASGHMYRFRARGIDRAGNVGAWASGSTLRLSAYQQSSSAVRWAGTWSSASGSGYWGGTTRHSSRAGATSTFTFTGRSVAWVSATGATRGLAYVYVNGSKVATVDLRSSTTQKPKIVWAKTWSSSSTRRVTIRVAGTSGRPRVDVDGFLTTR